MLQNRHLFSTLLIYFFVVFASFGKEVPQYMEFAGMKLRIHESARRKIAADVEALQSNPKYFQLKVERIDMYFPIIEKILEAEGLPDDFKYLAVQESSLISDAVSTSNAVGYWQFKKESALEVGLVIDKDVDERKHIVSATRGAARYLKRNNFYLQNWIYTLQSYITGLGGTQRSMNQRHVGLEKMDIDGNTHWYVLKFLAHKLAFEDAIGKSTQLPLTLLQYEDCKGKTLEEIAAEMEVPLAELELYNKWLNRKRVPENRDHIVIIPAPTAQAEVLVAKLNNSQTPVLPDTETEVIPVAYQAKLSSAFPVLKAKRSRNQSSNKVIFYTINGKPGVQAQPGDNITKLSDKAGITREKFLVYNDLKSSDALIPGEVYYLRKKRNRAKVEEHIVTEGETLWKVSQTYGITLKALMRKNRMKRPEKLQHGRVLWLRNIRPANTPVEVRNIPKPASVIASRQPANTQESKPVSKPAVSKPADKPREVFVPQKVEKTTPPASASSTSAQSQQSEQIMIEPVQKTAPPIEDKRVDSTNITEVQPVDTKPVDTKSIDTKPLQADQQRDELHTVTTGQTLYAIAKLYNVNVSQLRLWNNLEESAGLKVGQELIVSPPSESDSSVSAASSQYEEYTVQTGDTLYKIAKTFAVSVNELLEWNGKTDSKVAVGEKLKVKRIK
jgi:membrane-bound lytic murein transglycosylase D